MRSKIAKQKHFFVSAHAYQGVVPAEEVAGRARRPSPCPIHLLSCLVRPLRLRCEATRPCCSKRSNLHPNFLSVLRSLIPESKRIYVV